MSLTPLHGKAYTHWLCECGMCDGVAQELSQHPCAELWESHFQLSRENVPHAEGGTESIIAEKKTSGIMRQAQDYKAGVQSAVVCI